MFLWIPLSSVLKYMNQQKKKRNFKKEARYTEWQLPQLLAGILIKTKLVSFSEQTWQALSRRAFFSTPAKILSECRCSRNVYKGGGKAELTFFSLHCVCESPYVCLFMYLSMCFLPTLTVFTHALVARHRSTPSSLPLLPSVALTC